MRARNRGSDSSNWRRAPRPKLKYRHPNAKPQYAEVTTNTTHEHKTNTTHKHETNNQDNTQHVWRGLRERHNRLRAKASREWHRANSTQTCCHQEDMNHKTLRGETSRAQRTRVPETTTSTNHNPARNNKRQHWHRRRERNREPQRRNGGQGTSTKRLQGRATPKHRLSCS